MRSLSGKELAKLLERRGWVLLRINGSHHIYGKTGSKARISVPVHRSAPLKAGLLNYLLKLAGIPPESL
jgi:predicted RNA binding protein YcfA (HicA-like mRNA interferase family)